MKDEKKAPKLRFKGFTDDWEQCKLGDVCDVYDGIHHTPDYQDNGIMFLSVENISTLTSDKFVSRDFFEQNYKIFPEKGDILLTRIGNVGTPNVVESTDKLAYYVSLALLKAPKINSYFLCNLICTQEFKKELHRKTLTTAIPQKINKDEIRKITFFDSTSSDERKKIGSLLEKINFTITLHEEKKQQLKCLKSALLQKMFAYKNKSGDPDVRFKGFDERWERHMLNDLAIFNPKGTLPTSFEYVDLGSVIGVEMISHKTISKFDAPSRAQRLAQVGDLFYQTVRPYQQNNYLFDNKDNAYVFSTGYAQLRPLIDGYFLLCLVQTKSFVRKVMNACTGTSYPAINSQDLAQIGVNIPINSKEQRLIGNLYKVIDNLIMLYQQKLDDLNTIKQSLLQKMFI
ncbi:restriction endonuclease subunit S [Lactobacillus delbrueckii subsp. lactis]|uniref:restriction endonuclease subunit S n=2 Tax=Lactobacillus delbrueckii TaxID=1584 RepID=UPI001E5603EC|nr:restriction endonuclease subunit S [Lactobacillus delbrueckii]MCD5442565.1 restriction endonuclease subunit S [Lactobacillus delbrueckii subsp. lactis]MCT3490064.1 restriction endonuclease subunit S [Lactobacillus delbrueckii subsp. lactis]